MLSEIIHKYETFSDSIIQRLDYNTEYGQLDIELKCMNKLNDYRFEIIQLSFTELVSVRFVERENQSSLVVNATLITSEEGIITFDFFPMIFGNGKLMENEHSDFQIKCRNVSCKTLNSDLDK